MIDWTRPLRNGPTIPTAPSHFRGSLREYVERTLDPALPAPSIALQWHHAVMEHAHRNETPLLVRATSGYKQTDETTTRCGRQLRMTDNAPPWWIHAVAFSGRPPPTEGLASILDAVWCWMFHAKGPHANAAGWYVAHLLRAKPAGDGPPDQWDDRTSRQRFIRNVSPLNQLLVPKGNGSTMGESPELIATVADWYHSRFGSDFGQFVSEAGIRPHELGVPEWDVEVELRAAKEPTPLRTLTTVRPGTSPSMNAAGSPWWTAVLGGRPGQPPVARILAELSDADERLRSLGTGLTVEGFVGMANALFNDCRPADLERKNPGNIHIHALHAWHTLSRAKHAPRLGGKWARTVTALLPGSEEGLAMLRERDLDAFVRAAGRVVSHVYTKV